MITTPRLMIRRFLPSDAAELHEYLSDQQVVKYEPYDPLSYAECVKEAQRRAYDDGFWAVCLKDSGKLIGNIYFARQEYEAFELGFVFNAAYQGKGYAYESAKAVMEYAFLSLGARRIIAMCNPDNSKSWSLLERLGLRREGHFKQNVYFRKDEHGHPIWQDTFVYAILAKEWLSI